MTLNELTSRPIRRFVTSRGDVVETFLTDGEALKVLAKVQDQLGNFGFSLVEQAMGKRGLSERQLPWFHKIALEHIPANARPGYTAPVAEETVVLKLDRIAELMDKAAAQLKFPKIRFNMEEGRIQIARAGGNSRTPGAIMVTDGGPFGANVFYGRVHTDGRWEPARQGCPEWVLEALRELAKDPAGYAGIYGRKTGNCCFCGRDLTDGRSVAVGYGPICADRYGLPWGEDTVTGKPVHVELSPVTEDQGEPEGEGPVEDSQDGGWDYATWTDNADKSADHVGYIVVTGEDCYVGLSDAEPIQITAVADPAEWGRRAIQTALQDQKEEAPPRAKVARKRLGLQAR